MRKHLTLASLLFLSLTSFGQNYMTPEKLIELNRVSGVSVNAENIVYSVSKVDIASDKRSTKYFTMALDGSGKKEVSTSDGLIIDDNISPDGKLKISIEDIKIRDVNGIDFYPELKQSNMMIYNELNYRHWDTWEDGKYSHVMISNVDGSNKMDIMANEPFDCPQKPFGGGEDYIWSPDGKSLLYVTKKLHGTEYAVSTNTDIYKYDLATSQTTNLTEDNKGYDTEPAYSSTGVLG